MHQSMANAAVQHAWPIAVNAELGCICVDWIMRPPCSDCLRRWLEKCPLIWTGVVLHGRTNSS